jgi:hypothetical protein
MASSSQLSHARHDLTVTSMKQRGFHVHHVDGWSRARTRGPRSIASATRPPNKASRPGPGPDALLTGRPPKRDAISPGSSVRDRILRDSAPALPRMRASAATTARRSFGTTSERKGRELWVSMKAAVCSVRRAARGAPRMAGPRALKSSLSMGSGSRSPAGSQASALHLAWPRNPIPPSRDLAISCQANHKPAHWAAHRDAQDRSR